MFCKLFVVSTLMMMASCHPSLQLLAQLPSEEAIAISAQPSVAPTAAIPEDALLAAPEPTTIPASTTSEEEIQLPPVLPSIATTSLPSVPSVSSPIQISSLLPQSVTVQHHLQPTTVIHAAPISVPILATGLRTVYAPETIQIHQPAVAKVGDLVQKIPTAVSHQSQTVVHNHAEVRTPIVAPAVRTITSQIVRAYHTPLVYAAHAPIVKYITH